MLDELAVVLAKVLDLVDEATHPILTAAIRQAGVQYPKTKSEVALLAAPTTHDLVTLLSALSAQVTYGVSLPPPPPATKMPVEQAKELLTASKFRQEVSQLRRTLELRADQRGEEAISPRFSSMAHAIISREEQLQRYKEVLRSQRAANQKGLERVQHHMRSLQERPSSEVLRALKRMEDEHLRAEQKWAYKRECLQQERMRLMELAMAAFCKVVYVDRALDHRTLKHASGPGGDIMVQEKADVPVTPRMATPPPRMATPPRMAGLL